MEGCVDMPGKVGRVQDGKGERHVDMDSKGIEMEWEDVDMESMVEKVREAGLDMDNKGIETEWNDVDMGGMVEKT